MTELSIEEVKPRQLDVLSRIDKFCTDNGIHYSLAFGSLLGAIRHKGYIPWDDDIDIMMPRDDYDRFISLYNDSETSLVNVEQNPNYIIPFAKVVDNNTILIEDSSMKMPLGVYVDIFPVDNVPDDPETLKSFYKKKKLLNSIHTLKIVSFSSSRSVWKNIALAIGKILVFFVNPTRLTRKISSLAKAYQSIPSQRMAVIAPTDNKERWIVDRSVFEEYIRVPFENDTFSVIKRWDTYLTATYGNYMQLPPVEQRITHHANKVFLK